MVLRRCRTLLGDEELARDAMQDTFVQLLRRQDRLRPDAPSSLLYRMATNTCLNLIRSRKRRPEVKDGYLLMRIADLGQDQESSTGARRLLGRLFGGEKESTQAIAVLHLLDGMTLAEVAAEVGLSVSGVRKRLRNLRAHLLDMADPDQRRLEGAA
jgi:RNA polymerase sigma-70 factor (ECF subfamily)